MPPMNTLPNPTLNPQARNPWAIVQALRDGDVNPDDVRDESLDLIASRSTPQERDALVAATYAHLRLGDAVRAVEQRVLERMAAAEGAR